MKAFLAALLLVTSTSLTAETFRPIGEDTAMRVNMASEAELRKFFKDDCARLKAAEEARQEQKRTDAANMLDLEGNFRPIERKRPGDYARPRGSIPYAQNPFKTFYYDYPMNDGWSPYGNY